MDINGVTEQALSAYKVAAEWVYDNPISTDIFIGIVIVGSLMFLARKTLRMRRLAHRIRWGAGMKRSKNREAFERGLISFGICDAIEEAVWRGDMSRERADQWYTSFATDYNMHELRPEKAKGEKLKEIINRRITLWDKIKVIIPGLHPRAELKVDASYKPKVDTVNEVLALVKSGKVKSKYSQVT